MKKFYAVLVGREIGVFGCWQDCDNSVRDFPGFRYKIFDDYDEAENALLLTEEELLENENEFFLQGHISPIIGSPFDESVFSFMG